MTRQSTIVVAWTACGLLSLAVQGAEFPSPQPESAVVGQTGERTGSVLLYAADLKQMLLVGPAKGAPFIQAFDPAGRTWSAVSTAAPQVERCNPYYQAAYDPGSQTVFCLSGGNVLYAFELKKKAWKSFPPAAELDGLGWRTLACDPTSRRLVLVGADKRADNLGWSRTLIYDIPARRWTRLSVSDERIQLAHRQLVALTESLIDLSGRIRLAWYRDPQGRGTEAEGQTLSVRCKELSRLPQAQAFAAAWGTIGQLLEQRRPLAALQAARKLQRQIAEAADAQYPVPCARRNSPLAFDAQQRVFVLFGGDHEDYLMNDTWVLDLSKPGWERKQPERAPSPRAGHALFTLPQGGGVALYEGYVQSDSTDYGATPFKPQNPVELWRYDTRTDRWETLGQWPHPTQKEAGKLVPVGHFYGYADEYFSPPAIAADDADRVVLAAHPNPNWYSAWNESPVRTWLFPRLSATPVPSGLGGKPNARLSRSGAFLADYCEVPDAATPPTLNGLPENQWVRLPEPRRNPCRGCRQRDWGTAIWDSDRDQILLWGGGHCVRSASTVVHYSPASGRIVEGYDADEPYGRNGGGGYDSSLLNRPWVSVHNYNHYAYDPQCKLLVSARGYLYDPERMDWLRQEPLPLPFAFQWGSTVVETSRHGAVAWARLKNSDDSGLWLFDRQRGWIDLKPQGRLFTPYCDAQGMVYDSKRDRLIFSGVGGGYQKLSSGTLLAFDFATHKLQTLSPENIDLGRTNNARELVYVEHADWILLGDPYLVGDGKTGRLLTRVYDCAQNKLLLLDAGTALGDPRDPRWQTYSTGWMYDAVRRLVFVFSVRGEAWALKLNPQTAKLLEKPG